MTFLQSKGLDVAALDAEALLSAMRSEMTRCLGEAGDLPMLPSGICLTAESPKDREVAAFDVGGTNTRSARVHFDAKGRATVHNLVKGKMPGVETEVNHDAFYQQLCDVLLQNVKAKDAIGYCFSYPATPEGKLLFWTKNIQAPQEVGRNVVDDLQEALAERGAPGCKARMLNDTVAALLAAYAHDEPCAGYVGFILGTGTNVSYAEATEKIVKNPTLPKGALMPINCETGNFRGFPMSEFDTRHEAYNGNGHAYWERCISGGHLGDLGTEILHAAAEEGLFSAELSENIRAKRYTHVELDQFCAGVRSDVFTCTAEEAALIGELLRPMLERAALFTAVNIAAAGLQSAEANGKTSGVIRVNADGSTFWKTQSIPFVATVKKHLDALLGSRGYTYDIVQIEDAPLIGAAIAACE